MAKRKTVKTLGQRIARNLFTSGNLDREIAHSLVLTSVGGRNLGSWSEECMADQIDKLLRAARRTKGKRS